MKISYNWLKWYVPEVPEPNRLADIFTYHICEVESIEKLPDGDHVFDLGILPNRAHDLLSHHGVARELSGLLGITYNDPTPMYKMPQREPTKLTINIESDKCSRYMACIVRNVKVGPSPEWVVKHLESIGQRSINNIVDATNIVMYDSGQPAHAFDLRHIKDDSLQIKLAQEGEELKLVGREGVTIALKDSDLVVSSGGKTLGLAGVKGGFDSGVQEDTTDILLEVANFDPTAVRKTARRIGQLSDSAKRFENDLSPTHVSFGMTELSGLILEIFPDARFEDIVDVYPKPQKERTLEFSKSYVDKLLGTEISESDVENIFMRYEWRYTKEGDVYSMIVPPLRLDLVNREDMAEEIGRIHGYDKVKPRMPEIESDHKVHAAYLQAVLAREKLTRDGYREVMTYAFANVGVVEVLASASDKKFLRTNLSDGLKKAYELNKLNAPLLDLDEIKIFEIGTIFTKNGEEIHVAWNEKEKIREMPLDSFVEEKFPSEETWERGGASTRNFSAEKYPHSSEGNFLEQVFKPWSSFPFIVRDIAVWVPEGTKSETLSEIYKEFGTELLVQDPILVDTFTKNDKTSYAFRLIFQSYDRTLTDGEVNGIMAIINEKIASLGFLVR